METEYRSSERKEDSEKQSDQTEGNEECEKDFFRKVLEESGRDDDKKNIYIQYRIVNNHGIMASDSAQIEKIYTNDQEELKEKEKKVKRNIFSDESKRSMWLVENYEAYPMALMITVAVFDAMPYMWVMRAKRCSYKSFENKMIKKRSGAVLQKH